MEDLVKAGIIDPAKVTRSALQNAASIAALLLTTEALVADKPEKARRRRRRCCRHGWHGRNGWHGRHDVTPPLAPAIGRLVCGCGRVFGPGHSAVRPGCAATCCAAAALSGQRGRGDGARGRRRRPGPGPLGERVHDGPVVARRGRGGTCVSGSPEIRRPTRSRRDSAESGGPTGGPRIVRTVEKPAARHQAWSASIVGTYQFPKSARTSSPAWNSTRLVPSRPFDVDGLRLDHCDFLGHRARTARGSSAVPSCGRERPR